MYSQDSFDHFDTGKKSRRRAFSRRIFNFYRENQAVFITAKQHFFRLRIAEFAQGNRYLVRAGIKLQPAAAAPPGQQQVTMPETEQDEYQFRYLGNSPDRHRYSQCWQWLVDSAALLHRYQLRIWSRYHVLMDASWLCSHSSAMNALSSSKVRGPVCCLPWERVFWIATKRN